MIYEGMYLKIKVHARITKKWCLFATRGSGLGIIKRVWFTMNGEKMITTGRFKKTVTSCD